MRLFKRKREERAEQGEVAFESSLLAAITKKDIVTKEMALQIPSISGCVDLIANVIAGTPLKLYEERGGKTQEVVDDQRVRLLNDDTGDTLTANEFWRAMIRDYYLGKGGYAYICRENGRYAGLHYVDEQYISVVKNSDRIFKDYDILVQGQRYKPYDFLKILRATKDGATGTPVTEENSRLIDAAYRALILERNMARRGGRKKGFLESEKRLDKESLDRLREAFARLYGGGNGYDEENFVVLNNGVKFKESTSSAVEMQLNEIKRSNADEFARIFHVSPQLVAGAAGEGDMSTLANLAAVPLMTTIQCALNRDLLLEKEKSIRYWAFDTKELLKGNIKERFEAYKLALDANFMQIDEVRYKEDLPELGMTWVKLGLQDVLYDPKTQRIYTPNTNQMNSMEVSDSALLNAGEDDILEARGNDKHDPKNGRFAPKGGGEKGGKTKYAPSKQRNSAPVQLSPKKYAKLCGILGTEYPGAKDGDIRKIRNGKQEYLVRADGHGGFVTLSVRKYK